MDFMFGSVQEFGPWMWRSTYYGTEERPLSMQVQGSGEIFEGFDRTVMGIRLVSFIGCRLHAIRHG